MYYFIDVEGNSSEVGDRVVIYDKAIEEVSSYLEARGLNGISAQELIDEIITNNALIIYNDRDDVEFKHLSFQEYFTAYEYYHHLPGEKDIFIDVMHKKHPFNRCFFLVMKYFFIFYKYYFS